ELFIQFAGIGFMGAQVVGTDDLYIAGGSQQYEQDGDDTEPGIPDGFVHFGSPAPIGLPGTAAPAPNPEALTIGPDCMGRLEIGRASCRERVEGGVGEGA